MANFCVKCGSKLDIDTGLCPKCDAEELNRIKRVPKFCTKCGSHLDADTGLCPQCDAEQIKILKNFPKFCTECGSPLDAETGKCPNCSAKEEKAVIAEQEVVQEVQEVKEEPEMVVAKLEIAEEVVEEQPIIEEAPIIEQQPVVEQKNEIPSSSNTESSAESAYNQAYVYNQTANAPVNNVPSYENKIETAPVYNTAKLEEKKPEKKAEKKKKKTSAFEVIITVILSFALFVTGILAFTTKIVKESVSKKDIEAILEDVDGSDFIRLLYNDSDKVFYRKLNEYLGTSLDEKDIDKFINKSYAKKDIAKLASTYIEDFIKKDDDFSLETYDIYLFLMKNRDSFEDISGVWLSYEQAEKIANWIMDEKTEKAVENFSAESLKDDDSPIYTAVNLGLSDGMFIALTVLSLVWIAAMAKNNLSQAAIGTGIVLIIIGGVMTVAALMAGYVPVLWGALPFDSFISSVVGGFLVINLESFAYVLLAGIVLFVLRSVVLKIIENVNAKKAAKTAA